MIFLSIEFSNYYAYDGTWHKARSEQIAPVIIIWLTITPQGSYHHCLYFTDKETVLDNEHTNI